MSKITGLGIPKEKNSKASRDPHPPLILLGEQRIVFLRALLFLAEEVQEHTGGQAELAPIEGLALSFLAEEGRGTHGTHKLSWRL